MVVRSLTYFFLSLVLPSEPIEMTCVTDATIYLYMQQTIRPNYRRANEYACVQLPWSMNCPV